MAQQARPNPCFALLLATSLTPHPCSLTKEIQKRVEKSSGMDQDRNVSLAAFSLALASAVAIKQFSNFTLRVAA